MVEEVDPVFQVDSKIVKKAYRDLDNFLIINDNNSQSKPEVCAVYFSSNFIYYPNNESSFKKTIIEKNRYEWWNLRHPDATRHIFIRDIYKQWYLNGINEKLNSLDRLKEFLEKEIGGLTTFFIGSSAGGYAAVLLGSLLKVDRIYAFNNQFFLNDLLEKSSASVDPLIFREQNNPKIFRYYNIKPFIKNPSSIFYFHSNRSDWDIRQFNEVNQIGMNVVSINTAIHGIPLLKNNLKALFLMNECSLIKLTRRPLHPILFSFRIIGVFKTGFYLVTILPNAFMRIYNPIKNKIGKYF